MKPALNRRFRLMASTTEGRENVEAQFQQKQLWRQVHLASPRRWSAHSPTKEG
jgi:hypothetical protein